VSVVCYQTSLRQADPSSRGVLASVCVCYGMRSGAVITLYIYNEDKGQNKKESKSLKLVEVSLKPILCYIKRQNEYCTKDVNNFLFSALVDLGTRNLLWTWITNASICTVGGIIVYTW